MFTDYGLAVIFISVFILRTLNALFDSPIYILSKKYRELINKIQTIYYLYKFILLKVGPSRNNTLVLTNNPIIKIFIERIFRNQLQFSPRIFFYVFYRLSNLSFGMGKKSAGAISGEYGSFSVIYVEFLKKIQVFRN